MRNGENKKIGSMAQDIKTMKMVLRKKNIWLSAKMSLFDMLEKLKSLGTISQNNKKSSSLIFERLTFIEHPKNSSFPEVKLPKNVISTKVYLISFNGSFRMSRL
jgi:hypothetical protein